MVQRTMSAAGALAEGGGLDLNLPRAGRKESRSARFGKKSQNEKLRESKRKFAMAWTTPTLVEICIGLEINGYLPAEI